MNHSPPGPDPDFTEFVLATGPRLYRTAVLLCGDRHLAEDLVQTTFARLYASWRRVSRAGNPAGYAHTTLTQCSCPIAGCAATARSRPNGCPTR